ncbi:putative permease of the major facilitator superfamily [Xenorhabdus sp. KK7.4]|nr:putative permease of the major facilitator superfamily [Xenorhabdus sp. KK7.4]
MTESIEQGFPTPQRYFAAAAILIGVFMASLDSSIINISLPSISRSLKIDPASAIWITNSYQVASAATMLICASLGSLIGERRFYTIGMILFTLSSFGCGVSHTFPILISMRIIQGISYAIMISVGLGLYRIIFPPHSIGTIFGFNALAFAVGTATGPSLGGMIISYLSWQWLFYINIPLGILAIFFSLKHLGFDKSNKKGFDFIGSTISAIAFGLLVISVNNIGKSNNPIIILGIISSLILFVIFITIQKRSKNPLLPLDIFKSKKYSFAVLSSMIMFISQGMALVALPFALQHTYSYSALESALIFTPWPVAVAICAPIAGKLSNRFNPTQISTAGIACLCIGLALLAGLPENLTIFDCLWRIAICGIGYGLFLPPNNKEMFSNVEKKRTVTASGVLSTARTAGQSIGAALVAMIIVLLKETSDSLGQHFIIYVFGTACFISVLSCLASILRVHK